MTAETIECPGWMHRFLIGKNGSNLGELIEDNEKVHIEFCDDNKIIVEGPTNMIPKVIESLKKAIDYYVSTKIVVDQKFFKHIVGKNGRNIDRVMNNTGVIINISESDNNSIIICIEGQKDGVKLAKTELEKMVYKSVNEVEKKKEIDHDVSKIGDEKVRELEEAFDVQITFLSSVEDLRNLVQIRGLNDDVNKAFKYLAQLTKELDENHYVLGVSKNVSVFKHFHKLVVEKQKTNIKKSKKVFEKIEIPKMFHPFITGGHNEKLNSLMKETGVKIHVPPLPVNSDEIKVVGDKEGVKLAIEKIKQVYIKMEKESATVFVEIPKQKHKFLMAQSGNVIKDILLETNVSVEMPKQDSDQEMVTLRGLHKNLATGLTKLYEKANSMTTETIECPGWMHGLLIGKNGSNLRELIEDNEKVHIEFCNDNKIIVEGPTNMIPKVIESLKKGIDYYVSTEIVIDSTFFKHIIGKKGRNINRLKTVHGVIITFPESDNNSNIVHMKGRKDGVELFKSELEKMIYKLENAVEKKISIDQSHHSAIIGFEGEKVRKLQEAFNVKITFPRSDKDRSNLVKICGFNYGVNQAFKSLAKLAKELDKNNHVLEIPVFKQFHKLIVGIGGANMKKISEETNTVINLPREGEESNTIKVIGNKENVLIACNMIQKIQNEMGDVVTKEIVLGNIKVRNVIVNLGNKFIQSIKEDCGNVSLKLPATKGDNTIVIKGPEDNVDSAITQIQTMNDEFHNLVFYLKVKPEFHKYLFENKLDNVKMIRDLTNTRIMFTPETDSIEMKNKNIIIFGKKENVVKAKLEFEVMITDISNVVEDCIEINGKYHKIFVAKCGEFLHKLEEECGGIKISFPEPGAGNQVLLKGSKANVAIAKQKLLDHAKVLENTIQVEVNVEPKFHCHFFARCDEIINRIIDECNGVSITFPKQASNDDVVIIKGDKSNAEEAKRKIQEIVKDLENIIEITMSVPPKHHRHFVAHRNKVINQISAEYNGVTVTFPQINSTSWEVLIKGHKDFLEKVENKINNIVIDLEQRVTVNVIIPQRMHRGLMRNRDLLIGMKRDLDVWIKFPERRPAEAQFNRESDDVNVGEDTDGDCAVSVKDIVTIFGKPENCESAKQILIDNITKIFEMTIEPVFHPMIIGKKRKTIHRLINKYGVQIIMPREGDRNNENIVRVVGYQRNAERARNEIQKIVDKLVRKEIYIDRRIHPILIGAKGKNILKIMNKYRVYINVSKTDSFNPDLITVFASEDATHYDVLDCINYLEMFQQHCLAELLEYEARQTQQPIYSI